MRLCRNLKAFSYPIAISAIIIVLITLIFIFKPSQEKLQTVPELLSTDSIVEPKDSITEYVENWETIALSKNPKWNKFLKALGYVESRHNDSIPGQYDNAKSLGRYQITPVFVKQCNIYLGKEYFKLDDRYSHEKQKQMIFVINHNMNPEFDIIRAIKIHNPGASHKYKDKIFAEMRKQNN